MVSMELVSNSTTVAGVDLGDPAFAAKVRDHLATIESLIVIELGQADPLLTESVLHLFNAGGKRFRPLFHGTFCTDRSRSR